MGYLIGHHETKYMITYEDIKKAAIESDNKRADYLDKYRRMIGEFIEAYENSLAIGGQRTFRNFKGEEDLIVKLGVAENNEFKAKPAYAMMFSKDHTIPFLVKTVVDPSSPSAPWVAINCVIFNRDGRDCIEIKDIGMDPKICRLPEGNTLEKYTEAAETLKLTVLNVIKSSTPF